MQWVDLQRQEIQGNFRCETGKYHPGEYIQLDKGTHFKGKIEDGTPLTYLQI